jgi:sterol 3beta-glucosyltransferase
MPSTEDVLKKRVGRKLSKTPKKVNRLPSTHMPERFKYGEDANEDVTAPARAGASAPQYMNQSIFSMIAAAGSRTDFNARFDESSDSAEDEESSNETSAGGSAVLSGAGGHSHPQPKRSSELESTLRKPVEEGEIHKRKPSAGRLLKSLPKLSLHSKEKRAEIRQQANIDDEQSPGHSEGTRHLTPRGAPMMSRMLEAQAGLSETDLGSEAVVRSGDAERISGRAGSSPATLLATRLMEIFGFDEPESVVSEYPCWLLQTVLLQGYLYITRKHICFYAYLPKKSASVAKTGYLSKRGRQNRKYSRYWFTLKGDVLSYYSNPSDLFFPAGNIDLRYGISASLTHQKDKQKTCKEFSLTTDHRTYHFKADSHASAKEWVKNLQKVIFRSHNDGDSVKISLPIENVIDIEESPVVDFVDTLKVRVVESGDSYAIDEVCA